MVILLRGVYKRIVRIVQGLRGEIVCLRTSRASKSRGQSATAQSVEYKGRLRELLELVLGPQGPIVDRSCAALVSVESARMLLSMGVLEVVVDGFWKFGRCYITYFSRLLEICDLLTILDEPDTCGWQSLAAWPLRQLVRGRFLLRGTNHRWGRSCRCYRVHAFIGFVHSKKNDDDDDEHACAIN
jgi:hypothetical protein